MIKYLTLLQFLPLSVFLYVARTQGVGEPAWSSGFQYGAMAAVLEFIILIPLLGNRLNRLVAGANLFLIVGGAAFFFPIPFLQDFLDISRESGVFFFIGIVCAVTLVISPTGVFEKQFSTNPKFERQYSVYYAVAVVATYFWAYYHRGDSTWGGVMPFLFLILTKQIMQRLLVRL